MSLIDELKRRNVFKVAIAYIIVAWLLLQVSDTLVPALHLPDWFHSGVAFVLILGFPVSIIFAWAFEMTPEGLKRDHEVDRTQSITHVTGRKLNFMTIGVLVLALGYFAYDKLVLSTARDAALVEATTQAVTERVASEQETYAESENSIAVLPFVNMSDDVGNDYFSDGISEEILNALAHIRELKVAGRTSSFAFKGRNEDLRLIGETLNVTHILEGSVRKAGNKVRITAQLIQVSDGFHLWSETYDRELTDIFAIQDEIAGAILAELKTELMGDDLIISSRTDPRAYEKYLQARQLMYARTRSELEAAVVLLDEAMALDPDFAPAWAQRGIVAKLLSNQQYGNIPFLDAQIQIKRFAEHALALDEELAEGWAAMGLFYSSESGPESTALARKYLDRSLEINPSLMDASNWLYVVLIDEYRAYEALELLKAMFERDPLYPPLLGNMALHYLRMGLKEEFGIALERVRPFLGERPQFNISEGGYRMSIGDLAGALPIAENALARLPDSAFSASVLHRALFALNEFDRVADTTKGSPGWRVQALRYLGRVEEASIVARQWLEATRSPTTMIEFLGNSGQHEALITFIEDRWGSLDTFHREQDNLMGFGYRNMIYIARACQAIGRMAEFEQAMGLIRADHDRQAAAGINWSYFFLMEAQYWTMANDHDLAISFLDKGINDHMFSNPKISRMYPILKPLDGDPRFEAVQAKILIHLNQERAEAGLEPLEAGNPL